MRTNCVNCGNPINVNYIKYCSRKCFWDPVFRFFKRVKKTESCWIWIGVKDPAGYGVIRVKRESKSTVLKAHRFSWELANGPITDNLWVLHKCDIPACVNPDHLFLGTPKDNTQDSIKKKRNAFGERCAKSKIKEQDVIKIRQLRSSGMTHEEIAQFFPIGRRQVGKIVRFEDWVHL